MKAIHILPLLLSIPAAMAAPETEAAMPRPAEGSQESARPAVPAEQDPSLKSSEPAARSNGEQAAAQQQQLAPANYQPEQTKPRNAIGILTSIEAGTQGIGMSIGYEFNEHLKLRLRGAYLGYSHNDDWGDGRLTSQGKLDFDGSNVGMILDYHPWGGRFRISGGLNFSNTEVELKTHLQGNADLSGAASMSVNEYEFGGITYAAKGNSGSMQGTYGWNTAQPYLGIGWSSDGEGDRSLYFTVDLGVNFIGSGSLSVSASDNIMMKDASGNWQKATNGAIEHSVRQEGKDFFKIADDLFVYPVLQVGMGFRF